MYFFPNTPSSEPQERTGIFKVPNRITIQSVKPLTSLVLIRYLHQRHLNSFIAYRYCSEVHFEWNGKTSHAIGFKNDQGGYELRNEYFKISIAPKAITTLDRGAEQVVVFEDFFSFLSFLQIYPGSIICTMNFLVLNSLSFFEKARPYLEEHETIHLYLNNNRASQNVMNHALHLNTQYRDESTLYKYYKDLNDWLMHFGKTKKPTSKNSIVSLTTPLYT